MLMPIKTFKSPVDTDIRLYKINGNYFVPNKDIIAACGFTSRGSCSITCMMLNEKFKSHGKKASITGNAKFAYLIRYDDVNPALLKTINHYETKVKNPFHLTYFNETRRPQVEKAINFFEEIILPYVRQKNAEDTAAEPVSAVKKIAKNLRRVDPPKEEIQTLFASRVEDDKDAQIAALKTELAELKTRLHSVKRDYVEIFRQRLKELYAKEDKGLADFARLANVNCASISPYLSEKNHKYNDDLLPTLKLALKLADYFNVSLDWLCGRDECVEC